MYDVRLSESLFPAQSDTPYRETTIAAVLREQAEVRGDALALRELLEDGTIGREWSFAALRADSEKLGRALASRHAPGARIAIYAANCPEWVLIELAAALAGLTLVTVNPALQAREVRYTLEQSDAEAVYFTPSVRGAMLEPIVDQACDGLDRVAHRIDISDRDALFAGHDAGELRETGPEFTVQIQYTSGTTGFPKGAMLHQKGLLQNGFDIFSRWGVGAGDTVLCCVPLFHTSGSAINVLGCLTRGATLLLAPLFDPAMLVEVMARERPDFAGGVPTMLVAMVEAGRASGQQIDSIRALMSGGAMVAPELARGARQTFGAPVQIIYGQTETSPGITFAWADDSEEDLTQTIGQPLPHIDVAILDPDGGVCPLGVQGEICVRGYNVMTGYNDDPEATAATIDEDGWLHSGDLGTMDARGYLKVTGRVKEMIIRGGENLFPAEIENAMLEHPAIAEVAVVGIPDDKWGELVACFMRCAEGAERPDPAMLKAFVRERLSPQKTPAYWVWTHDWPMTGSGKIRKFALRDEFVDGRHEALTV